MFTKCECALYIIVLFMCIKMNPVYIYIYFIDARAYIFVYKCIRYTEAKLNE